MNSNIKIIAFYLPQFHPIPENDAWWGKGFTEWTNVTKAKPLFKGHYQPKLPSDLGFYDLRVPEIRDEQASMARKYGVSAFCYWHYWFGNGKRLLNLPFDEVLKSDQPDFPFCLAWANSSWKGFDYGCNKERNVLIEQHYPGEEDYIAHFNAILPAFKDHRYLTIEGKPVFLVFQPFDLPNPKRFIDLWEQLAHENGLNGIFFIAQTDRAKYIETLIEKGFNAVNIARLFDAYNHGVSKFRRRIVSKFGLLKMMEYRKAIQYFIGEEEKGENCFPTVYPNWDHSARSGKRALILHDSKPAYFRKLLKRAVDIVKRKRESRRVIFIKSWNEWAEGNYLEPDIKHGFGYLEAIQSVLEEESNA